MVNFEIDNAKPNNNRVAAEPAVAFDQGALVAVDANGQMVLADAANGVQGQAVGVALTPATDLSVYAGVPEEEFLTNLAMEERNVILGEGDRAVAFVNDILITDRDAAATLSPGQPVYLGEGGGITQTAPATSGSVVQIIGFAQSADSYLLNVQFSDTVVV